MSRKILFFDVDETLMDGRTQRIPDSAVKAIIEAHENGHLIFINTGR
ncbi:MAG: HAD hydrolase family protein, partial [Lachnospiraceae bacterium]|nr:HAD hydrolase family protein [Lachnospiraceae bacterium]